MKSVKEISEDVLAELMVELGDAGLSGVGILLFLDILDKLRPDTALEVIAVTFIILSGDNSLYSFIRGLKDYKNE